MESKMLMGVYKRMKIKVLIIGGGYGALRYVESLIWDEDFEIVLCGMEVRGKTRMLAQRYGLPYVSFGKLTEGEAASYDCVIVTLPAGVKKECVRYLMEDLSFRKALVLEKPLALDQEEMDYYEHNLTRLKKCGIVCQRDFEKDKYHIEPADEYHIMFPSNVTEEAFNMEHMLPHILSWLITEDDSLETLEHVDENTFSCIWRGTQCRIDFVPRTEDNLVLINGIEYPNVQYRRLNAQIIKKILLFEEQDTMESINKAFKVSRLLIGIM